MEYLVVFIKRIERPKNMENNIYFEAVGTSNIIKEKMLENIVINKANSDFLFNIIENNQNLLSDDEYFEKQIVVKGVNAKALSFLTTQANYHINIKIFTLAFICLLFDMAISDGVAAFLLGLFGVNYSLVKLNGMEKCVAYKIKSEKSVNDEQLTALTQCNFTQYNTKCGNLNADGSCKMWREDQVKAALDSLISKKIIKMNGMNYEIIF